MYSLMPYERILRILIRLGFHGKSHKAKEEQILSWMHDNGIGV